MPDTPERQAMALFRYGLIAELLQLPAGERGQYARLRAKAAADYSIPGSTRTRVAPETLRHWIKDYRRGGFDALVPRGRTDSGRSRALPQAVSDALLSLKEEQPHLSIPQLISAVGQRGVLGAPGESAPPAPSTVHRLLRRAGLMDKATQEPEGSHGAQDRRRFAFAQKWLGSAALAKARQITAEHVQSAVEEVQ